MPSSISPVLTKLATNKKHSYHRHHLVTLRRRYLASTATNNGNKHNTLWSGAKFTFKASSLNSAVTEYLPVPGDYDYVYGFTQDIYSEVYTMDIELNSQADHVQDSITPPYDYYQPF